MRQDSMYNVHTDVTMLQLLMAKWQPRSGSNSLMKESMIPRLLWVHKDMSMKELHFKVFKHMRFIFSEWADWTHPETQRVPKSDQRVLKTLIPFPYRRDADDPQMSRAEFDALTDEEAFSICCRDIFEGKCDGF
mmetsp:Transcript_26649/g.33239  ORF Transcript_26649/g.33239 Transcript_26649/m.33239 type:complete len:134 (+) Transcript_26649:2078-2479(+)|eukprot:CAMPEP_0170463088 /NCGR_PEP_ID=MMETSP0123-20130129/8336_1 /TAXON_ID=182087 /ORGANISM="Favella ehrenbergii, Strain Fehren 1" /LENGTH=133 /DNA_ID=CAMNT_0010728443 /DNA_START=2047 /DNA_END=2451 /DNA_ORIENTATION=-